MSEMLMISPPIGGLEYRLRNMSGRFIRWLVIQTFLLFTLLTLGAIVTLKWPDAPWVRAAHAILTMVYAKFG